jgi:hypothetical protein
MSGSGAKDAVIPVPLAPKLNARSAPNDPLERAGHLILDMVRQAAENAQASLPAGGGIESDPSARDRARLGRSGDCAGLPGDPGWGRRSSEAGSCGLSRGVHALNKAVAQRTAAFDDPPAHERRLGLRGLVANLRLNSGQCPLRAERDRIGVRERNDV